MRITFAKHHIRISVNYVRKCGHKFTRTNSDWYTISPFNTMPEPELRSKMSKELSSKKRACPKCKEIVKPQSK